ncbi:hypothetical protein BDE02_05G181400 [Populus trichocarpa]|nr:hypothetical protein BDE02_05G181400 [Populus trichocarpa]
MRSLTGILPAKKKIRGSIFRSGQKVKVKKSLQECKTEERKLKMPLLWDSTRTYSGILFRYKNLLSTEESSAFSYNIVELQRIVNDDNTTFSPILITSELKEK